MGERRQFRCHEDGNDKNSETPREVETIIFRTVKYET